MMQMHKSIADNVEVMVSNRVRVSNDDAHALLDAYRDLEKQLQEERAKRETAERTADEHHAAVNAELVRGLRERADKAERELAEERNRPWVAECLQLRAEKDNLQTAALRATEMQARRAEAAEARIAALQALVDAVTDRLMKNGHLGNHGHRRPGSACAECGIVNRLCDLAAKEGDK
jgi:hypothetical protein